MRKMGESQVIDFFFSYLKDSFRDVFGAAAQYTVGNFSGSQDRKFSDFFAGTDSHNLLIEFKEKKEEYRREQEKPLREKLCLTLDEEISELSRQCHFIGWDKGRVTTQIELNPYIDLVCRLWGIEGHLLSPSNHDHEVFVDNFIDGMVGVDHDSFVDYINHLNKVAGGGASGADVPFRSILYSRNDHGRLVGTRFENLGELNQLRNLSPKPPRPAPRGPSGSSGPSF
ncbi:MAG: hypothetical protein AB7E49_06220 [Campylobacterales bacterium]